MLHRRTFAALPLAAALATACGDGKKKSSKDDPVISGNVTVHAQTCTADALAVMPEGFGIYTGIDQWNELHADASGLVFGIIPDVRQVKNTADVGKMPYSVMAGATGAAPAALVTEGVPLMGLQADATHAYYKFNMVFEDPAKRAIQRMPRAGGPAETVYAPKKGEYLGAMVIDADSVYVVTKDLDKEKLVRIPKAGGAATVLAERAEKRTIEALAIDGDTLYFVEQEGLDFEVDKQVFHPEIYSLKTDGSGLALYKKLPDDTTLVNFDVIEGNAIYHQVEIMPLESMAWWLGKDAAAPVKLSDKERVSTYGYANGEAYFSDPAGLKRVDVRTGAVELRQADALYDATAIGVGPDGVYWANGRCLYRTGK